MLALARGQKLQRGIADFKGKEQVAVVISNGRKVLKADGGIGGVIERDRFHIVMPNEDKTKVKPYHPAYEAFNKAPAEKRRVIYGILSHVHEYESLWYERKAQQLPISFYRNFDWFKNLRGDQKTVAHPNRFPACCGGAKDEKGEVWAKRWMGRDPDDFKNVPCPGAQCEFAVKTDKNKKPPCGPSLDFIFQLMWKDEFANLRPATARYVSHGWNTLEYFVGFFDKINTAIKVLGIENPVLYGFPFMLSLGEKTNPVEKWNWPVVTITELMTPLEFFYAQIEKRKQLKEMAAQIPAVITVSEEMAQRPTVYVMDEIGPLKIGNAPANGVPIIDVEPEAISEPPDVENGEKIKKAPDSKPQAGKNGIVEPILLFPADWEIFRAKTDKKLESKWKDLKNDTLAAMLEGRNETQKQLAINELRYRIFKFAEVYAEAGQGDDYNATINNSLSEIPVAELAGVCKQLQNGWKKLNKAA